MNRIVIVAGLLLILRWLGQVALEWLNLRHVQIHATSVPEPFKSTMDEATYAKSVAYTFAKSRFSLIESLWSLIVLLAVLFSGVLPLVSEALTRHLGHGNWIEALFLLLVAVAFSVVELPFAWWSKFRLEERFGFNTSTFGLWLLDHLKGAVLAVALGFPLIWLMLWLVHAAGTFWWIWAWASFMGFQLLLMLIAPAVIMPLFNKFTTLPDGPLRQRLFALAQRTDFPAREIQVMDGSRRSRHSNAFFTGLGRFRKIVLFDTLVEQLTEAELEAVLAHEIGHYRRRHVPKMLAWSAVVSLAGFGMVAWLLGQEWFLPSFGFPVGAAAPGFLLFALLSGAVSFWWTPLANRQSRRFEYEADAYAADATKETSGLIGALRKLSEKNLSNLTPHPWYSGFHYSHPTLLEREQALLRR